MPTAADYAKLKEMSLADLIGNALDRVGVALRACQDASRPVKAFALKPRLPEDAARILARAQELLREAERKSKIASEALADSLAREGECNRVLHRALEQVEVMKGERSELQQQLNAESDVQHAQRQEIASLTAKEKAR